MGGTHILHLVLAIRNRGYTNKVHLRGLTQNQCFQPAQAGFACVAATSSARVQDVREELITNSPFPIPHSPIHSIHCEYL